jgi:WD40 repeat protein/tRNA A-37 threonylcarbamoyl transferase component Bud32
MKSKSFKIHVPAFIIGAIGLLIPSSAIAGDNPFRTLEGHSSCVRSVAFSPEGKYLASGSYKTIKIWETTTGKLIRTLEGHSIYVHSVAFSPDGKFLASGSLDGTIKIWETATGELIRTLEEHSGTVDSVAFSPDGKYLASGSSDKTIKIWETATGELIRTLEGHSGFVNSVAFSPDGKYLASGNYDNTIKIWETATGKLIRTLEGHSDYVNSVAFSPDGKYLASGSSDNTIKIWETATGKLIRTLEGHSDSVNSVAFSPDGKYLASGSVDKTIKIWETTTGKLIRTLEGHSSFVLSVAFSPDGKSLASGSNDNTIKIWEVKKNHFGLMLAFLIFAGLIVGVTIFYVKGAKAKKALSPGARENEEKSRERGKSRNEAERKGELKKFIDFHASLDDWDEVKFSELDKYPEILDESVGKIKEALFRKKKYRELINFIKEAGLPADDTVNKGLIFKSYAAIGLPELALKMFSEDLDNETRYDWAGFAEGAGQTDLAVKVYYSILSRGIIYKDADERYKKLKNGEPKKKVFPNSSESSATNLSNHAPGRQTSDFFLKYDLGSEIGSGGMGIIYKAVDTRLNRPVAIKKLKEEIRINKSDKERFLREAKTVASLKHPNIVEIYDIAEEGQDIYLVFEYLDGEPLSKAIAERGKPFTWEESKPILRQICSALSHAHSMRIVHRDLKPANVMLLRDGRVKLMDFGIAREAKNTVLKVSGFRDTSGTLMYMAPEQHVGEGDERADIYSLGVTLYEMLTCELPFKGADLYEAKKQMVYKKASELAGGIPRQTDDIIAKALQFDKNKRMAKISDFLF